MNEVVASLLLAVGAVVGAMIGIPLAGRWADKQFKDGKLDKMLYFPIVCIFGEVIGYALLVYLPNYPSTVDNSIDNIFVFLREYPVFWWFILIFNICLFFGTAVGPVVGMARTHINLPEQRGTAAAIYDTADFIGAAIALTVGALLSQTFPSLKETIFFGSLFWLVSGSLWFIIIKHINKDYQEIRKMMKKRAKESDQTR